jgi:hypothetical protein
MTHSLQMADAHPLGDHARDPFGYMPVRLVQMCFLVRHIIRHPWPDGAASRSSRDHGRL